MIGLNEISLPKDHTFLDAQLQNKEIVLWANVDSETPMIKKQIFVVGTGIYMQEDPGTHIATVQLGSLVWHIFDIEPE